MFASIGSLVSFFKSCAQHFCVFILLVRVRLKESSIQFNTLHIHVRRLSVRILTQIKKYNKKTLSNVSIVPKRTHVTTVKSNIIVRSVNLKDHT